MIRLYKLSDFNAVKAIHNKYYKDEFPFPFNENRLFVNQVVITNDDGDIVTYGAVELTAELIAITDKEKSSRNRYDSLYRLLEAAAGNVKNGGLDMLHCSIKDDDEVWLKILNKVGFQKSKGQYLYLKV